MSDEGKEVPAPCLGFHPAQARKYRVERLARPSQWSPGVRVTSAKEYDRFTDQLARELLATCTPEHIAVIAAQHMMYADELKCLLSEERAISRMSAVAAKIISAETATAVTAAMEEASARAVKLVASEIGRHAAKAKHKPGEQQKAKALADWDEYEPKARHQAHFARNRYKDFGVTERTLIKWIGKHEASKTKA